MTDKEIIYYLQHNKYSSSLKGLYQFFPLVKKHITNNNGTNDDAQDIFQDVLVILYKKANLPDFMLTGDLKSYILAISKRCWYSELRQRKKLPMNNTDIEITEELQEDEEQMKVADAAFSLLGKKCKQLLIEFYFKKKSFRDIANALGFSDEMVAKNQKYRCLQKAKGFYLTILNNGSNDK